MNEWDLKKTISKGCIDHIIIHSIYKINNYSTQNQCNGEEVYGYV